MTQALVLKTQNFCLGIRQQLGYPLFKPANDCTAFTSGGMADLAKGIEIAGIAEAMRKDIVYTGWKSFTDREPTSYGLALRDMLHVDWISDCFFWAPDETAPLVIVPTKRDEHYVVGARGLLERRPGRPTKRLGNGKRLAMRRIHDAAQTMGSELMPNNVFVPAHGRWAQPDPAPVETIVRFG